MIRIGSIGLGGISHGVHIPGILKCPDFQLVALCDIDADRLKERAAEYGIPEDHCFTDYRALIDCPDVDAVDISTPNDCHAEIAEYAARAGKPFDLEKPITMNADEARRLHAAAEGIPNMICFSYRYKVAARYARELIRSGRLGRIYHVNAQYYQAWGLPSADCGLVWRFVKSRTASGALGDLGCHVLDLASFITGENYRRLLAHNGTYVFSRTIPGTDKKGPVDVDDFSNILIETDTKASFSFQISRFAYGRGNYQRLEIYGDKGALVYSLDRIPGVDELEIADASTEGRYVPAEIPEHCRVDQMQSFADIVLGKADGLSATLDDGLRNQIILDALLESAEKGEWVEIP